MWSSGEVEGGMSRQIGCLRTATRAVIVGLMFL